MNKSIDSITVKENSTLRETMECINRAGIKAAFVVDNQKKLLGVVTDGDIRRAILSGKNLEEKTKQIMTCHSVTAVKGTPADKLLEIMDKHGVDEVPIVDGRGVLVDVVLLRELKTIPLSSPDITEKEVNAIRQVLATPFLSIGPKVTEFEKRIADYIGTKYAIAVNSGTSGLHLCVRSLGIHDGDEVITTPFSFIASANCLLFERAKPVFADIDEKTLCLDVSKIEEKITAKTKAILPVHIFGHPCEMDKIMEIARKYKLAVIEDACEAIGAEYQSKKVGSFGNCGVFAFYANKQITTGEGGMIVTNDENIAKLCRSMRNQGRGEDERWLAHVRLGYNYRMSELSASLGLTQIERISEMLAKRSRVADLYNNKLKKMKGIEIPYLAEKIKMSWFVYVIRLDSQKFSFSDRDKIINNLENKGIQCRNYFPAIHLEPFYREMFNCQKGDYPITEKMADLTIALPFYNNLSETEIDYIVRSLQEIIEPFN